MNNQVMIFHNEDDIVGLQKAMNGWFTANKDKIARITHVAQNVTVAKNRTFTISVFYETK